MSDAYEDPARAFRYLISLTEETNRGIAEQQRDMENWYDKYLRRHLGNFAIAIGTVIAAIIAVIFGVGVHMIGNIANATIGKVDHLLQQTNQQIVESRFPPELTNFVLSEKSSMEKQIGALRKENDTLKDEYSKLEDTNKSLREQLERLSNSKPESPH